MEIETDHRTSQPLRLVDSSGSFGRTRQARLPEFTLDEDFELGEMMTQVKPMRVLPYGWWFEPRRQHRIAEGIYGN